MKLLPSLYILYRGLFCLPSKINLLRQTIDRDNRKKLINQLFIQKFIRDFSNQCRKKTPNSLA